MVCNLSGVVYTILGVLVPLFLFLGKSEMCAGDAAQTNPDCPFPSVSDAEHQSPRRNEIVLTTVLRSVFLTLILLNSRSYQIEERDAIQSDRWNAAQSGRDKVAPRADGTELPKKAKVMTHRPPPPSFHTREEMEEYVLREKSERDKWERMRGDNLGCDCAFMTGLLTWAVCDVMQVMISNKTNYDMHTFLAHLAQFALCTYHIAWFRRVLVIGDENIGCAALGFIIIVILFVIACYLLANLGNTAANESWSNTQWMGIGFQAGLFFTAGFTL